MGGKVNWQKSSNETSYLQLINFYQWDPNTATPTDEVCE